MSVTIDPPPKQSSWRYVPILLIGLAFGGGVAAGLLGYNLRPLVSWAVPWAGLLLIAGLIVSITLALRRARGATAEPSEHGTNTCASSTDEAADDV